MARREPAPRRARQQAPDEQRRRPSSDGGRTTRKAAARRPGPDEGARFRSRTERSFELPNSVIEELRTALAEADGDHRRRSQTKRSPDYLQRRLTAAAEAYDRDRYEEALAAIRPVAERAPTAAAVMELYGLILYRLGRWRQASKVLGQLHELTGSFDQYPVIADSERALGHFEKVGELWNELRRAGVDREVLVEGRLVMAGALADQGRLDEAIALLEPEAKNRKRPDLAHLRQWYALADLYERAGDLPRARQLFGRVQQADPEALDAPARLRALR